MKKLALAIATLILGAAHHARALDEDLYARVLQRYTRSVPDAAGTRVDYAALATATDWRRLVASVEQSAPSHLTERSRTLAFWINAYNILAIEKVLEGYPLESIRDLGNFIRPVWVQRAGEVEGHEVSLDEIEHRILRPMREPRIHMAIVCASTSCPALRREPYRAETLDAQLDDAVRTFLADPRKGMRVDREAGEVWLSSIFDWFAEDFERVGGVLAFAARYASEADRAWLDAHAGELEVRYLDYDWGVNGYRPTPP